VLHVRYSVVTSGGSGTGSIALDEGWSHPRILSCFATRPTSWGFRASIVEERAHRGPGCRTRALRLRVPRHPSASSRNYLGFYWSTAPDVPTDASLIGLGNGYAFGQLYVDYSTPNAQESAIEGIWGTAAKVVAVGGNGTILVFNVATSTTSVIPAPSNSTAPLGGVWGSSLADVWIVGLQELVYHGSLE
jgi:hypothetical protein